MYKILFTVLVFMVACNNKKNEETAEPEQVTSEPKDSGCWYWACDYEQAISQEECEMVAGTWIEDLSERVGRDDCVYHCCDVYENVCTQLGGVWMCYGE